jgi:hypothetical protein
MLEERRKWSFTLTRMIDDYDSDPPAALPKLTKQQHEYKFIKDLPSQLFRHPMLDRKCNEHFSFVCTSFGHENFTSGDFYKIHKTANKKFAEPSAT